MIWEQDLQFPFYNNRIISTRRIGRRPPCRVGPLTGAVPDPDAADVVPSDIRGIRPRRRPRQDRHCATSAIRRFEMN
jgi:hypothetical protein